MAAAAILDFGNREFLFAVGIWGPDASLYQISSKSVVPMRRYCDFWNFHDGRRRHLGFV